MKKLIVFVLHNDKNYLNNIKNIEFIEKVNLNYLSLNQAYQRNELAENRFLIYLSNNNAIFDNYEYVGIASARWNEKYDVYTKKTILPIEEVGIGIEKFKKNHIYVPAPIKDWYHESCHFHEGMNFYLDEILQRNNFKKEGMSFYSNNFIARKDIMVEFLKWWRKEFDYFFGKYGLDYDYDSTNFSDYKEHVNCAYFYERLTISYFANKKYEIVKLEPKVFKSTNFAGRQENLKRCNNKIKFF